MITAMHSVVIKQSLNLVNGSTLLLSWYTNLLSAIILIPLVILAGEGRDVVKLLLGVDELITAPGAMTPLATFLWGSAITGVLGFMMSLASLLSIKVTSPITHMISSAVRGVAASLLGMWIFHDVITTGRASSIAIILAGSLLYTWFKHQESQPPSGSQTSNGRSPSYERLKMEDLESAGPKESSRPE